LDAHARGLAEEIDDLTAKIFSELEMLAPSLLTILGCGGVLDAARS